MVYKSREDSFLIKNYIKKYANANCTILDIGTGTGILAKESAKYAKKVLAIDINQKQVSRLKKENHKNAKIQFIYSNLFSNIGKKEKFDIILFNPPYLPSEKIKVIEIDGGKNGTEIIKKFLSQAKDYLKQKGKILIICSNLNKDIENLFKKYNYKFNLLSQKSFFFEKIFLYLLESKTYKNNLKLRIK